MTVQITLTLQFVRLVRIIYHHRGTEILADSAKAMVDMIFLCFPGFGYLP